MNKHTENLANLEYCYEKCELGKAKGKEFIEENNSAFDAAIDFHIFVEECKKTCNKCIEA
jgi:hypothetical protein